MGRLKICEAQARRKLKYPSDRICFYSSQSAATEDQSNIRAYIDGEISLEILCLRLAFNNYLEYVSKTQALNELKIMGWL